LLLEANCIIDLYEGILPLGGKRSTQKYLLNHIRENLPAGVVDKVINVDIQDNYYSLSDEELIGARVFTHHNKADFAVGHTANYIGFFPIILYHNYQNVFFNIERSADRVMTVWNNEGINHQWCKSIESHNLATTLFNKLYPDFYFTEFNSTIRGMYDTSIYEVVATKPEMLSKTLSCNIEKPWCSNCPKCMFCYLMMTSVLGESFAKKTMQVTSSLFSQGYLQPIWHDLLNPSRIAWECVPSSQECHLAIFRCIEQHRVNSPVLTQYVPTLKDAMMLKNRFEMIDLSMIPEFIHSSIQSRFPDSRFEFNSVTIKESCSIGLV
jgi:UDP-N-acetyl-alpha-D-muramoyl-L-alanyl-L-glutamate epimerase